MGEGHVQALLPWEEVPRPGLAPMGRSPVQGSAPMGEGHVQVMLPSEEVPFQVPLSARKDHRYSCQQFFSIFLAVLGSQFTSFVVLLIFYTYALQCTLSLNLWLTFKSTMLDRFRIKILNYVQYVASSVCVSLISPILFFVVLRKKF
jgi:hypothetical protein